MLDSSSAMSRHETYVLRHQHKDCKGQSVGSTHLNIHLANALNQSNLGEPNMAVNTLQESEKRKLFIWKDRPSLSPSS